MRPSSILQHVDEANRIVIPLVAPALGFGMGLRAPYYEQVLGEMPAVDWFEVLTENYLVRGGKALHYLDR